MLLAAYLWSPTNRATQPSSANVRQGLWDRICPISLVVPWLILSLTQEPGKKCDSWRTAKLTNNKTVRIQYWQCVARDCFLPSFSLIVHWLLTNCNKSQLNRKLATSLLRVRPQLMRPLVLWTWVSVQWSLVIFHRIEMFINRFKNNINKEIKPKSTCITS